MGRQGILFVVSSPSGGGKTTLCHQVMATLPDVVQSVSYTTRAPRAGERDGHDYYFVATATFQQHIAAGDFLEWAQVHEHYYGTSRQQVVDATAAARDVFLIIDVQGAAQLRKMALDAVFVFVVPPSWEVLETRLRRRASETATTLQRRLAVAREEITHYTSYDYVIVNGDLESAAATLRGIILAERHRVERCAAMAIAPLLA